jgi:hypothetical protein
MIPKVTAKLANHQQIARINSKAKLINFAACKHQRLWQFILSINDSRAATNQNDFGTSGNGLAHFSSNHRAIMGTNSAINKLASKLGKARLGYLLRGAEQPVFLACKTRLNKPKITLAKRVK